MTGTAIFIARNDFSVGFGVKVTKIFPTNFTKPGRLAVVSLDMYNLVKQHLLQYLN